MNNTAHTQNVQSVTVAGISVRQDAVGRYCLNDLHKAAGGEKKNQPGHFTARKETAELAVELVKSRNPDSFVKPLSSTGGRYGGTYACKELVYSYAMWISPSFHLQVIRAYDEMYAPQPARPAPEFPVPQTLSEALRLAADQQDRIEQQQRDLDHAIATKAQISSSREASVMGRLSAASRKMKQLEQELGRNAIEATVTAVEKAVGHKYGKQGFRPLKKWCKENAIAPSKVPCPRYGEVVAWPAAAWLECYGIDLTEVFGEVSA